MARITPALQLLMDKISKVEGDTPADVMKGGYDSVAYIDKRGVMPHEPNPNFPIKNTPHHWAYNPEEGPTCRQCHMFYYDAKGEGRCTNVRGGIQAKGSCDVYEAGPILTPEEGKKMSNPFLLSKIIVKYVYNTTGEGYSCKRCRAFVAKNKDNPRGVGRCKVLKPDVEGDGCCILFNNATTKYVIEDDTPAMLVKKEE